MKVKVVGLVALCCTLGLFASFPLSRTGHTQTTKGSPQTGLSPDERDLLNEINRVRPTARYRRCSQSSLDCDP